MAENATDSQLAQNKKSLYKRRANPSHSPILKLKVTFAKKKWSQIPWGPPTWRALAPAPAQCIGHPIATSWISQCSASNNYVLSNSACNKYQRVSYIIYVICFTKIFKHLSHLVSKIGIYNHTTYLSKITYSKKSTIKINAYAWTTHMVTLSSRDLFTTYLQ